MERCKRNCRLDFPCKQARWFFLISRKKILAREGLPGTWRAFSVFSCVTRFYLVHFISPMIPIVISYSPEFSLFLHIRLAIPFVPQIHYPLTTHVIQSQLWTVPRCPPGNPPPWCVIARRHSIKKQLSAQNHHKNSFSTFILDLRQPIQTFSCP